MRIIILSLLAVLTGCAGLVSPPALTRVPSLNEYCLAAQRVVTRTDVPVRLVVHDAFDAFVKSKAVIEGPEIQQLNWYDEEQPIGVSCKLKSADHLNLVFGDGAAGPDGLCQDMNRAVYDLVRRSAARNIWDEVVFDMVETVSNEEVPGMTGPDWLAPYPAVYTDGDVLHIRSKGFIVDFTDPQFARAPARFRGVHYCHFLAPEFMRRLLTGDALPSATIGQVVDTTGFSAPQ